jgi:hypothetical protein
MEGKHPGQDPPIRLITDPKKLAWLNAKIERREAEAEKEGQVAKSNEIRDSGRSRQRRFRLVRIMKEHRI